MLGHLLGLTADRLTADAGLAGGSLANLVPMEPIRQCWLRTPVRSYDRTDVLGVLPGESNRSRTLTFRSRAELIAIFPFAPGQHGPGGERGGRALHRMPENPVEYVFVALVDAVQW